MLPWLARVLIICFLALAAFLRIWLLDRIPSGIVMDEFDYVLNAKFVYHTGTNIYNNWSPWPVGRSSYGFYGGDQSLEHLFWPDGV